jgi:hypothetical protein
MSHEYPIEQIPDTPLWSENYAAMFMDDALGISILYSCGRWHADPTLWREMVAVDLPDGRLAFAKNFGRHVTPIGPAPGLSRYEVLEPERRARLRFDGPMWQSTAAELTAHGFREGRLQRCRIDVEFNAAHPLWNMASPARGAHEIAGSIHTEQVGIPTGTLDYDGKQYRLQGGYSIRDHSRGVRNVENYYQHCWMNGRFPGGRGFHLYSMQLRDANRSSMATGVVFQDDRLYCAEVLQTSHTDSPADIDNPAVVILKSELGVMTVRVTGRLGHVPLNFVKPFDPSIGAVHHRSATFQADDAVRIEWDGQTGLGWCERGYAKQPL